MMMKRSAISALGRPLAVAVAAGLAATALAACGTGTTTRRPAATHNPQYAYYRSMMSRYHGGMMMGGAGYRWMTGTGRIPGWMHGGRLPGYMMGAGTDPGTIMGRFWANAPGPRVSPAQATVLGNQTPAGARINRAVSTITFTTTRVRLPVLASPASGPDETFRISGLVNPKLIVPAGARVSIQVINADPGAAHGLVITASHDTGSQMPMMTAGPAFGGSALWFLGNPTSAGMHAGTLTFTASTPGAYRYLCAVPGHARAGMTGTFIVTATR